jgi:hypothetical protein
MSKEITAKPPIENFIHEIRSQRVILDSDLAVLYGVTKKRLLEQFRRNRDRFPDDFAIFLTKEESTILMPQIAASSFMKEITSKPNTLKTHGGRRTPYLVFTEHGAIMAATILNSDEAVAMSIFVVRAFVALREVASQTGQWLEKLHEVESRLSKRMDGYEDSLSELFMELEKLMVPSFPIPEKKSRIGFHISE